MKRFKPLLLIGGCLAFIAIGCVQPELSAGSLAALVIVMVVGTPALFAVQLGSGGR